MADDTASLSGSGAGSATIGTASNFVALRTGLTIRHYIIEEVIGAGGFGITYRARHERLTSKIFALKEFFPRQFAARQGTHVVSTADGNGLFRWGLDRFLKEAEALAKCEHPGIVDVVDYFEENGTAYAVLGYVEGRQLGQWLDQLGRPPTQAELDRVLMPLLDALEVVHGAKLLHRDIAPDNILVRRDGSPCLIDFGACREDIRDRSQKLSAIVKHGYSPPEQYHGIAELQGPWTDIYAVAATLYRAIAGRAPLDSSRRGALGDTLQPVSQIATTDYRPGFMAAIDAALRLKPDERPRSVAEWRAMLTSNEPAQAIAAAPQSEARTSAEEREQAATSVAPSAAPLAAVGHPISAAISETPPPPPAPHRRRAFLAAAAALALIAVGSAAWWRGSVTSPDEPKASPPGQELPLPKEATRIETKPGNTKADPEAAAASAWRSLADSTDAAAIERFLAEHGSTTSATAARTRLAALQDAARRKADEDVRTRRQATLDANWQACRNASESGRAAACQLVVESDDTALRRASALHLIGVAARNAGDYDTAVTDHSRSLALVPNDAQVLNDRGIAHFLRNGPGDREAAMRDYDSAIRADSRHAEALNNRAWSLFQSGQTAAALADASRSIEAVPTNGYAYDTRGQIFEALGRKDEAIRDFERALSIDPNQDTSRAGLARLRAPGR